eukprot:7381567-Prymnesium_polylepis.1
MDARKARQEHRDEARRDRAAFDPTLYEEPTSDPYLVFSIDAPSTIGCKSLRRGGYFGRSVRTDMVLQNLNPFWEEARGPLTYLGTRWELENEVLRVRVYDWDAFSADDLIGYADVPLAGLLEYGRLRVDLSLDVPDGEASKQDGRTPTRTVPAGSLTGLLLFDGATPMYQQLGAPTVKRAGVTYLAARFVRASRLLSADANGLSDPYAVIDFDGAVQSSRVVPKTLDPEWEQTVYLPLRETAPHTLAAKGPVVVRVFDQDEAGSDLLGSCEIELQQITSAPVVRVDDEFDAMGAPYKGRVLKLAAQPLSLPGHRIASTIELWLYFLPDFP